MAAEASPNGLGARGSALWKSLGQVAGTPSGELALEACRSADRLEELDRIIAGKGVLDLMRFRLKDLFSDDDSRSVSVEVKFDHVLAEARQQQGTFRALLAELGLKASATPAKPSTPAPTSPLDELARRRASTQ